MLRTSAIFVVVAGLLSACGHTPEERLVSGALIGGLVGATVGVISDPHHDDRYGHGYRHHRGHHRGYRRHRGHGYYDY